MTEPSNLTSTGSAAERAAEAEEYGGVPISDSELGEVWQAPAGSEQAESAPADTVSDPAKDDSVGGDWSDEGGATPSGPATDVSDDSAPEVPEVPADSDTPEGKEPPD